MYIYDTYLYIYIQSNQVTLVAGDTGCGKLNYACTPYDYLPLSNSIINVEDYIR